MSDWGKVPREVFMDRRLKPLDIRVFGILCAYASGKTGVCTRRQEAIAEEVDATRESVNRSLTRLVSFGYLEKRARAGMKRSLEYRVLIGAGANGQLPLFEQAEAPRLAKPGRTKSTHRPAAIRDVEITSVVTSEITSVVTSDITSIEHTPVNRTEPVGSAAAARERETAANDRMATVVALPDLGELKRVLREAAGAAINEAHPSFISLAEPTSWLVNGCDLHLDVVPIVQALAARPRRRPVRSWGYFTDAVLEARDRRLAAAQPRAGPTSNPASQPASFDRPDGRPPAFPAIGARYGQPPRNAAAARHESHLGLAEDLARWTGRLTDDDV